MRPFWHILSTPSCSVALLTAQTQTMLGPRLLLSVLGQAKASSSLDFPICAWGSWWEGAKSLQVGGLYAACLPHKALSFFLPPLEGKLPINERELQTQCLAPRPRSLGEQGESERAGRGIGNKCMGCFLWWIHSPLLTPYSYRCPKFGLLRKQIPCLGFP